MDLCASTPAVQAGAVGAGGRIRTGATPAPADWWGVASLPRPPWACTQGTVRCRGAHTTGGTDHDQSNARAVSPAEPTLKLSRLSARSSAGVLDHHQQSPSTARSHVHLNAPSSSTGAQVHRDQRQFHLVGDRAPRNPETWFPARGACHGTSTLYIKHKHSRGPRGPTRFPVIVCSLQSPTYRLPSAICHLPSLDLRSTQYLTYYMLGILPY